MEALKAALIGCGGMGRSHLRAVGALPGVAVTAICDGRAEACAAAAADAPGARGYDLAEELLAEQRPDLVVVATNGPSHAALTIAAAEAGARWVMCEKPMATSLRDARAMINSCAQHGTRLAINHTRRWSPAHQRFAAALAAGAIGEIRSVGLSLGAGRTGCNGSHMLDLTRLLTGAEFHSVSGWLDRTGTPDPRGPEYTDPGAHAVFHLNNGARCFLDQMEDLGVPPLVDLIGTVGRARVEDLRFYWELRARRPEDRDKGMAAYGCALQPVPFEVDDCPSLARWQQVQEAAYHNLLSDEPIACSGEDGYRAIEAVLAIHLSDRRGHSPVALPLQGEDLDFRVNFT